MSGWTSMDRDGRFTGLPVDLYLLDGQTWIVRCGFSYRSIDGRHVVVPRNFATDFASIPRFAWRVIGPPAGHGPGANYGLAAIIHDFLYHAKRFDARFSSESCTRKEADAIFLEVMRYTGVRPWRAWLMHVAVRWFGAAAWKA